MLTSCMAKLRRYFKLKSVSNQNYAEGHGSLLPDGTRIEIVPPEQHSDNCTTKTSDYQSVGQTHGSHIQNMRNRGDTGKNATERLPRLIYVKECLQRAETKSWQELCGHTVSNASTGCGREKGRSHLLRTGCLPVREDLRSSGRCEFRRVLAAYREALERME